MSAICGIVNFDGSPVETVVFRRMCDAGHSRGPDVQSSWMNCSTAFSYSGICPLWGASPNDQPLLDKATGIVVAIDGRIDARDDLSRTLLAMGFRANKGTDADLVLQSYLAWDRGLAAHILGEFAFAIWDPCKRTLLCARDACGVRPLFFTEIAGRSVRFATGVNQLLADPALPRKIDTEGLVDFWTTWGTFDPNRTPAAGIRRLPAGHVLAVDSRGLRIERYWSAGEELEAARAYSSDPVGACAEALKDAIRDRLRDCSAIGMSLSGGWDAGTIFSTWQSMRMQGECLPAPRAHTYYWNRSEADDRAEVRYLIDRWPAESILLDAGTYSSIVDGLIAHTRELGLPESSWGWAWLRAQGRQARRAGLRALMHGEGGNQIVQSSFLRPMDFALQGDLIAAFQQVGIFAREFRRSRVRMFWRSLLLPLIYRTSPVACHSLHRLRRAGFDRNRSLFAPRILEALGETIAIRKIIRDRVLLSARPGIADLCIRLEELSRETLVVPWLELEGVSLTTPYLDRRFISAALIGMCSRNRPERTRGFIASVLQRTSGNDVRTKDSHIGNVFVDTMRRDALAANELFRMDRTIGAELVHAGQVRSLIADFQAGDDSLAAPLWRLVMTEAWLAAFDC
jgi:Glutamine amidotransferase domain/Asparagine synthase